MHFACEGKLKNEIVTLGFSVKNVVLGRDFVEKESGELHFALQLDAARYFH